MSLIGMTTSPEAYLAREAEMCYSVMAHVTDYDVWHESEEPVTVEKVVGILNANLELAQNSISNAVRELTRLKRVCACKDALSNAILTDRRRISPETARRLEYIVGRYVA
jgi:5'-methylthioadenosine phosphorylase